MAFKLSKDERTQKARHVAEIAASRQNLEDALSAFNDTVSEAWQKVAEAVESYNSTLSDAREFAEEVASRLSDEMADKSDRWAESERAEAVDAMRAEWESVDIDDIELDEPESVELDTDDHGEALEALPDEPES